MQLQTSSYRYMFLQVVTATPEASVPIPPSVRGYRFAAIGATVQVVADALIAAAFCSEKIRVPMFAVGIPCKCIKNIDIVIKVQDYLVQVGKPLYLVSHTFSLILICSAFLGGRKLKQCHDVGRYLTYT